MSKLPFSFEVDELLGRLLDGDGVLSPLQRGRLDSLLRENPELLDQFVITTALANDLQHVASLAVSADGELQTKGRHLTARDLMMGGLGVSLLALAASVLIVVLSSDRLWQRDAQRLVPPAARPEFVATVVTQDGWAESTKYPTGSRIPTGVLELENGVVQLQFDSGPNLLLEGPATLEIRSVSYAHLASGKLVFRDDSGCDSFQLSTPWSELADLGTEYAVSVSGDDEEVYVFSGAVERTGVAEGSRTPVELLRNGQAMRYKRNVATEAESVLTDPQKFIRSVDRDPNLTARQVVAYEPFAYSKDTALMKGRANGGLGWAGPWRQTSPDTPGHKRPSLALRVGDSLVLNANLGASEGRSLGYVGHWLMNRDLAEPIDLAANRVVYMSFLYRPAGMWEQGENSLKVMFFNPGEGFIEHRIAIALEASRGLVRGALCGARKECPLPMSDGSTYLIVAKVACSTDNPDQLMLRIFQPEEPISAREPSAWTVVTPPIQSDDSFSMMCLLFNCKQEQRVDEFRIGSTWESVTSPWSLSGELTRVDLEAPGGE